MDCPKRFGDAAHVKPFEEAGAVWPDDQQVCRGSGQDLSGSPSATICVSDASASVKFFGEGETTAAVAGDRGGRFPTPS